MLDPVKVRHNDHARHHPQGGNRLATAPDDAADLRAEHHRAGAAAGQRRAVTPCFEDGAPERGSCHRLGEVTRIAAGEVDEAGATHQRYEAVVGAVAVQDQRGLNVDAEAIAEVLNAAVGPLLRKIAVARFTRTLGTLITSGVPILEGLAITAKTSGNAVLEEALLKVRKAIEEGRTIVDPLKESGVFPNMVTQMIGVGEATGAMDNMLQKIGDFYEDEVDAATRDMLAMLEPVIIGLLGVSIGGIVISLYLPLFSMIAKLAG